MSMPDRAATPRCSHECHYRRIDCAECRIRDEVFFARLDLDKGKTFLASIRAASLDHDVEIYRQGASSGSVYSIRRGVARLALIDSEGGEHTVRVLGKGALIGLEAMLHQPYALSATALTDIDLCRIPVESVRRLAASQPVLYESLMEQWQKQLSLADLSFVSHSSGAVYPRVVGFLTDLSALCRRSGVHLQLPSNRDCASMVSSTIESVSRVMADLKRKGILVHRSNGLWDYRPATLLA